MIRIFLTTILVSIFSISKAQTTDYLVTTKGDTIFSEVKRVSEYKIKYRSENDSNWIKLTSKEVKMFYDTKKGEKYISILMPLRDPAFPDPKFRQVLEQGKINLVVQYYNTPGAGMGVGGMGMGGVGFGISAGGGSGRLLFIQKGANTRAWEFERKLISNKENATDQSREKFEELIADKPELLKQFKEEKRVSFDELIIYIVKYNSL